MSSLRHEARLAWREPIVRWSTIILVVLTALCLWNGYRFQTQRDAVAAAELDRSLAKQAKDMATVIAEASGTQPVNPWGASEPAKASWNAARPSGPLAALSFGQEDIVPLSANVSLWMVRTDNLFRKYQLASPIALSMGRFDAGFLVVLLLPLFVLALTYGVVAGERESGRLRVASIAGADWRKRLGIKFALRVVPVALVLVLIALVALAWGAPMARILVWIIAATFYTAFWAGIAVVLATRPWRQEVIALAAGGVWLLVVVLLPATAALAARAFVPPPSAIALINTSREASLDANRELMENLENFANDHPELVEEPLTKDDWAAKLYVSQLVVERRVDPVVIRMQQSIDDQSTWAARFGLLSPTSVLDDLLSEVAGTSARRQSDYRYQVLDFLHAWRAELSPLIFSRTRMTPERIAALPRFRYTEPAPDRGIVWTGLGYLALIATLFLALARVCVQRLRP
jgi:ABC-2 type transport system permease protein